MCMVLEFEHLYAVFNELIFVSMHAYPFDFKNKLMLCHMCLTTVRIFKHARNLVMTEVMEMVYCL